jgi:hypothetical protein
MNRNATGFLATGALLSALAASPRLPAPSAAAPPDHSGSGAGVLSHDRGAGGDGHEDIDFAQQARRDYSWRLESLFLDVCRDGMGGLEPESEEVRRKCAKKPGQWTSQASSGDGGTACLRALQATIKHNCKPHERDFIVALVPDPVHTRLALLFDRIVEVIQEASQDQGFHFVKALTPWDPKAHPESDKVEDRLHAFAYAEAKRELPGVLAFRRAQGSDGVTANDDSPFLFVFLVGESPTGGISKQQFLNAMDWIQSTEADQPSAPPSVVASDATVGAVPAIPTDDSFPCNSYGDDTGKAPTIRILGPTFSGSLASLTQLLKCSKNGGSDGAQRSGTLAAAQQASPMDPRCGPALVFSGTVTSTAAAKAFRSALDSAVFVPFQESDEETIKRFRQFLATDPSGDENGKGESIALLSEDETEYGAVAADKGHQQELHLHFPREISRLRAAYQGIEVTDISPEAQSAPRAVLPPNFEISGADDDTIAAFSKQSPMSQEGVLLGIVSELRKHATQFVLLRATDPIDLLFLSRYLAAAYPRGRIVTLGADMLFRREVEDSQLHGILALSTYSLAPTSNHGYAIHSKGVVERQFPSSGEAGTYNALRALFRMRTVPSLGADGRYMLPSDLLLHQYGWREAWQRMQGTGYEGSIDYRRYNTPPVHLLALGRDDYWPIAHLGPGPEPGTSWLPLLACPQLEGATLPITTPISWVAAEMIALLLAVGFAASLWLSSLRSPSQLLFSLAPAAADERAAVIALAACVITSIVALLYFPLLGSDWIINLRSPLRAVLLVALLAVAAVLGDLGDRVTRRKSQSRSQLFSLTAPGLIGLTILASILCLVVPLEEPSLDGVRRSQVLRSLQLTSGLSPVLPMLLLLGAWLWWAFHVSASMALLDGRRPRLPKGVVDERLHSIAESTSDDKPGKKKSKKKRERKSKAKSYVVAELLDALHPTEASVGQALFHYGLPAILSALALALLLSSAQLSPRRMAMSLESDGFNRVLLLLLWLALAGILGTTLRLWEIWVKSRRLLVNLDSLPLRDGFGRLKGFEWKPLWRLGLFSMAEFRRILTEVREARRAAERELPWLSSELGEMRSRRVFKLWNVLIGFRHPFLGNWRRRRRMEAKLIWAYAGVQDDIARAAGHALDYLARWWHQEPPQAGGRPSPSEVTARACERFVCLVYVSFFLVVLVRLRTLIVAAGGMYILVVVAMTVYPFQPRAAIAAMLAMLLIYLISVVTLVLAQLHRDATLSHLTNTKPGNLGSDFWVRATSFAVLPLLTFLASQFPQINRVVYSWLEPALRALNK